MTFRCAALVIAIVAVLSSTPRQQLHFAPQEHGLTVRGRVTDVTGQAIPGVEIVATYTEEKRIPRLTVTDESGEYWISGLAAERIRVNVRMAGLREEQKAVYLAETRANVVDFTISVLPLGTEAAHPPVEPGTEAERLLSTTWHLPMQRAGGRINPGNANMRGEELRRQEITLSLRALDKQAIPALLIALKDPDREMRRNAAFLLMDFAAGVTVEARPKLDIEVAVPGLIVALDDVDDLVRSWSAQAVGYVGPAASVALPALRRALNDPSEDVRRFARISIDKIEKK